MEIQNYAVEYRRKSDDELLLIAVHVLTNSFPKQSRLYAPKLLTAD